MKTNNIKSIESAIESTEKYVPELKKEYRHETDTVNRKYLKADINWATHYIKNNQNRLENENRWLSEEQAISK